MLTVAQSCCHFYLCSILDCIEIESAPLEYYRSQQFYNPSADRTIIVINLEFERRRRIYPSNVTNRTDKFYFLIGEV